MENVEERVLDIRVRYDDAIRKSQNIVLSWMYFEKENKL